MIRPLSPYKGRVQTDFEWLASYGHRFLNKHFKQQKESVKEGSVETVVSPDERAENALRRMSYIVGAQLAHKSTGNRLDKYFRETKRPGPLVHGRAPSAAENPFFSCLHLLMCGEKWMTPSQKSKSAKALLYAYRHKVPPQFLTGFILQTGTNNAAARSANPDRREPWFALWPEVDWIRDLCASR